MLNRLKRTPTWPISPYSPKRLMSLTSQVSPTPIFGPVCCRLKTCLSAFWTKCDGLNTNTCTVQCVDEVACDWILPKLEASGMYCSLFLFSLSEHEGDFCSLLLLRNQSLNYCLTEYRELHTIPFLTHIIVNAFVAQQHLCLPL